MLYLFIVISIIKVLIVITFVLIDIIFVIIANMQKRLISNIIKYYGLSEVFSNLLLKNKYYQS